MRAESTLHELHETGSGDRSHLPRSLRQSGLRAFGTSGPSGRPRARGPADHRRLRCSKRLLNRVWLRPGAAKSTGHMPGHMPLRHRLRHVHGAIVCLVDEYKTSQLCCRCGGQLGLVREPGRSTPVWHVKRCPFCKNGRGAPLTRHRDLNAAANILDIYLSLATLGKRPSGFTRARPEKKRVVPTPSGSAHPHGNQTRRVRTRHV